jgi:hypothetical protein
MVGSRGRFGFCQREQTDRCPQNIIRQFEHHSLTAFRASPVVSWRSMGLSGEALAVIAANFIAATSMLPLQKRKSLGETATASCNIWALLYLEDRVSGRSWRGNSNRRDDHSYLR